LHFRAVITGTTVVFHAFMLLMYVSMYIAGEAIPVFVRFPGCTQYVADWLAQKTFACLYTRYNFKEDVASIFMMPDGALPFDGCPQETSAVELTPATFDALMTPGACIHIHPKKGPSSDMSNIKTELAYAVTSALHIREVSGFPMPAGVTEIAAPTIVVFATEDNAAYARIVTAIKHDLGMPDNSWKVCVVKSAPKLLLESSAGDVHGYTDLGGMYESSELLCVNPTWVLLAAYLYEVKTTFALTTSKSKCVRQAQLQLCAVNQFRKSWGYPPIPVFLSDHSTVMYVFSMDNSCTTFSTYREPGSELSSVSLGWGLGLMKYFLSQPQPVPTVLERLPSIPESGTSHGNAEGSSGDDAEEELEGMTNIESAVGRMNVSSGKGKGASARDDIFSSPVRQVTKDQSNESSPSDPGEQEHPNPIPPEEEAEMDRNIQQGLRNARRAFTMEEFASGLPITVYDVGWE
jgi:hypothetical protein